MLPSRRISAAEGFAKIQKIRQKLFDNEKFFILFNNELNEGNEFVIQILILNQCCKQQRIYSATSPFPFILLIYC